jgi:phosphate-selective porin OprO and OprP
MRNSTSRSLTPALAALLAFSPLARADELTDLRDQLHNLEQKILVLERKQEIKDEDAAAAALKTPKITIDDGGFTFASPDTTTFIKLHGLVQADSRWFSHDTGITNNDTFLIRRARLIFEGAFGKIFSFQLVPEFGGGAAGVSNAPVIYDANVGVALDPAFQLKFGKFKSPIGQEMLQNDAFLLFAERSLATNLVPFRDVGVQASGDVFDGRLNYAVGVFNGAADATYANNVDLDNNKDFVARVIARPFRNDPDSPLSGLGFGIAGSHGLNNRSATLTSGYKSDAQETFFSYRSTVLQNGESWRVAPQLNFYSGPFGLQGEYTVSAVTAVLGLNQAELHNEAWQAAVGYVLTGEDASYAGFKPRNPFNLSKGTWGAVEVGARVAQLKIDRQAFPIYADPLLSARQATAFGIGVNWYLNQTVRATLDYFQTDFDRVGAGSSTNAVIGQDEKAIVTRLQIGF